MSKIKGYWEDTTNPDELEFSEMLPNFRREPDYLPDAVPAEFPVRADEEGALPF